MLKFIKRFFNQNKTPVNYYYLVRAEVVTKDGVKVIFKLKTKKHMSADDFWSSNFKEMPRFQTVQVFNRKYSFLYD